jgi:hypothetical protein
VANNSKLGVTLSSWQSPSKLKFCNQKFALGSLGQTTNALAKYAIPLLLSMFIKQMSEMQLK